MVIGMVLCSLILVMPVAAANEGKIAFCSYRDGNSEIYVMNVNGTNVTRLTFDAAADQEPSWAPDGSKIVFSSDRGATAGYPAIYVMAANGTNPIRLTTHAHQDSAPAWSPDGSKIAFTSKRDGYSEIYVMNADGSNQVRLTNNGATDTNPAWSPDGSMIAFTSRRDGNYEIYVMYANGSNQVRLTNSGATDTNPAWSPDGSKIAFDSCSGGTDDYEICVINADGTGQIRLTNNTVHDESPAWSPDGSMIAYYSVVDSTNLEIFVMMADGTGATRLTTNTATDNDPAWSPNPAPVTVISPNGGEKWQQGSTQTLRWRYSGDAGPTVKIEALRGTSVLATIASSHPIGSGGSGFYNLTFPLGTPLGSDYIIRVTSTSNATFNDTSDAPFRIIPPIMVIAPNGGEEWQQGTTHTIRWDYIGNPGPTVKIEALKGDVVLAVISPGAPVGPGGSGSLNLTLPINAPVGTDYRIRVTSTSTSAYSDTSDAPFRIIANASSSISMVSPNGGENWVQGSNQTIRWTSAGNPGPLVKIEALRNGTVLAVITPGTSIGTGGSGSFNLTFPYNTPLGSDYRIRITSTSNPAWTDTSDAPFTIIPAITVATPNGGEHYPINSILPMSWTYSGNPGSTVNIQVIKNTTVLKTLTGIPIGTSGFGSLGVTIPASTPTGSDYTIRVASASHPACFDASNGMFAIGAPG